MEDTGNILKRKVVVSDKPRIVKTVVKRRIWKLLLDNTNFNQFNFKNVYAANGSLLLKKGCFLYHISHEGSSVVFRSESTSSPEFPPPLPISAGQEYEIVSSLVDFYVSTGQVIEKEVDSWCNVATIKKQLINNL
jgi:hypothetical protein